MGEHHLHDSITAKKIKQQIPILDAYHRYIAGPLQQRKNEYWRCCPFHTEQTASFSINPQKGLFSCFGCGVQGSVIDLVVAAKRVTISEAINLLIHDFNLNNTSRFEWNSAVKVREHFYQNENWQVIIKKEIFKDQSGSKQAVFYRLEGDKWRKGLNKLQRPLFRLPEVVQAINAGQQLYIVEGEKDSDSLWAIGLPATTTGGAKDFWQNNHLNVIPQGHEVIILTDNDDVGQKLAVDTAKKLSARGCRVKVINLPRLPPKGDVSDWLAAGNTRDELLSLVNAAEYWKRPDQNKLQIDITDLTDVGNATRFFSRHGDKIKYCFPWKTWFIYDGKRWRRDNAGLIVELAKDTITYMAEQSTYIDDLDKQRTFIKWCKQSKSRSKLSAMIELTQSLCPILPEEFDTDVWLLNCQNGVLDLRTGKLTPHSPEMKLSRITTVDYQPNATSQLWEDTVNSIFKGCGGVISFVQRFAGYSLSGSTREEKFTVCYGAGGNGKGTLLETLAAALGDYAETLAAEVLLQTRNPGSGQEASPEIAKLPGVRLLLASETGEGRMLNEAKVKSLSGGDALTARHLHCSPFKFIPQFKIWLQTNHLPRIKGTDEGIWRRIRLIPFQEKFDGNDRDFSIKERLKEPDNLVAVLAWAANGCFSWQTDGLQEPPKVMQATECYREESDVIAQFIDECCVTGIGLKAQARSLYSEFSRWCDDTGREAMNETNFSLKMSEKRFEKKHTKTGKMWSGIGLKALFDFQRSPNIM
ncbi:DNA primase [Sporomusaceae bacterium FL31]|nr:DNA primase [Sporomusaceae bacterium FL31]GCE34839.1 DNA primase [Sporomusaceae bacterium]